MSLWSYVFFRINSGVYNKTCQESGCSCAAVYQVKATSGDKEDERSFCVNHTAASAARVCVGFPPVDSKAASE